MAHALEVLAAFIAPVILATGVLSWCVLAWLLAGAHKIDQQKHTTAVVLLGLSAFAIAILFYGWYGLVK